MLTVFCFKKTIRSPQIFKSGPEFCHSSVSKSSESLAVLCASSVVCACVYFVQCWPEKSNLVNKVAPRWRAQTGPVCKLLGLRIARRNFIHKLDFFGQHCS